MTQPHAAPESEHQHTLRKAMIPVAGFGTRMLPATKAVPKGLLPLIDKPVVQYIVDEAVAAGLDDLLLITGPGQPAFSKYFGAWARIGYVTQDVPRGLGDAVLRGADFAGTEPFAILFGDNVLSGPDDLLARMLTARNTWGGTILALTEVQRSEVSSRAVVAFEPSTDPGVVRITDIVEKPAPARAPSTWIMIGRCICDPAIFRVLRETPAGHGGEIQLSDALRTLATLGADQGGGVHGVFFGGHRLDTGNTIGYVQATVELACSRADLSGEFLSWLRGYARTLS